MQHILTLSLLYSSSVVFTLNLTSDISFLCIVGVGVIAIRFMLQSITFASLGPSLVETKLQVLLLQYRYDKSNDV